MQLCSSDLAVHQAFSTLVWTSERNHLRGGIKFGNNDAVQHVKVWIRHSGSLPFRSIIILHCGSSIPNPNPILNPNPSRPPKWRAVAVLKFLISMLQGSRDLLSADNQGWVFAMAKTIFAGTVEKR